jgi:hypothetical protein
LSTSIKSAFQVVGVRPIPANQKIWQYIKDKGSQNANQIAAALKLPSNTVSSQCGQLRDRKMVVSKTEMDQSTGHKVHYFSVPAKLKKFELLPVSVEAKTRIEKHKASIAAADALLKGIPLPEAKDPFTQAGTANLPAAPVTAVAVEPTAVAVAAPAKFAPAELLDHMSVREAYAMYLELKAMFCPQAATA